MDELLAALLTVFRLDEAAIVEPLVPNMVEYNVAVRNNLKGEGIITSAIERPLSGEAFLDFEAKYMRGSKGGAKGGVKAGGMTSEGMASLVRVMHPEELTKAQIRTIRDSATLASKTLGLAGSVRIDFLCDKETGELWLNEINTIPGSFAYYLWAEADPVLSFTALTDHIIEEGFQLAKLKQTDTDTMAGRAVIFGKNE
jgi:D-alanine-D-alanine ligase